MNIHCNFPVSKFIEQNQLPHLLFYGPPGTGKTTSILASARKLYSEKQFHSMVLELNGKYALLTKKQTLISSTQKWAICSFG